ncbi:MULTISPECIES: HAMP domain-containing sensor histidine kinase [Vagococcus]|uniref:histidine kinase n=1 Tax=Vagococcus fluvialis bH819 TaxID=1255619 RepID=A0A1X6WSM5_9ENTE|nr:MULTISPECIES: HAMP domain-containing sensor histidine kinase [Vagococcus]SLM87232.1 Phosphate regulon sensor protein PhoR (SphS) [Vagococcus fluvialis bH819]HCM89102.1 sensor histidine kinase [Vagococcus sp.]
MKFRVFFLSIILFLVVYFGSLLILGNKILQNQIESGEQRATSQINYLSSMFNRDIVSIRSRDKNSQKDLDDILIAYSKQYSASGYMFDVYKKDQTLTRSIPKDFSSEKRVYEMSGNINLSLNKNKNKKYYIRSINKILDTEGYFIETVYDISPLINDWKILIRNMITIGVLGAILFSVTLYRSLTWVFSPIKEVTTISKQIAEGKYDKRISIKSGQEAVKMANYFNTMADTIQKNIDELKKQSVSRQNFIDNISHELRTPISSIHGYAELLLSKGYDEEILYLSSQQIMKESKRIISLSEKLLYLSGVREEVIIFEKLNVQRLCNDIFDSTRIEREKKNIELIFEIESEFIYGNLELLQSLFINFVNNSIQASDNDKKIFLKAYTEEADLIFIIIDEGKGISKDQLLKIKEPFYRVDSARNRQDGGLGLGLSICAKIVEIHKGEMFITSELEKGTEIKILFTS